MDLGASAGVLATLAAALVSAGLLTGFLAGLLGIGGGALLVPVLYEVFAALGVTEAVRMHLAVGTSLAVIVPTSIKSFSAHRYHGAVDMNIVRRLALPVVLGVVCGVLVARISSAAALKWIWAVFAAILALKLLLGNDRWRLGSAIPKSRLVELYGAFVGFISTMMSVGGGAYITTFMMLYGRSIRQAVATSSGFGPMIAVPGTLGFVWAGWGVPTGLPGSLGFVSLLGTLLIAPAAVLAAPWGVRLAHGIPRRALELAFAAFMAIVALRYVASMTV
jgi:uncharacterized protein